MAKLGEGDERWIVKERADGQNCNNWHWTTKDVSGHTKTVLGDKLKELAFPADGPLAHCRIKSAECKGDCSVNNRKGRTFLIYELEIKLKWEGELRDEAGAVVETTKGSMKLPDVSATEIDDLEVEFESKSRGSALSEAMRKQGVALVKKSVKEIVLELQPLIDALHSSECCLETLDLAFNRLTDAGVQLLLKALAGGAAVELSTLCLGGNKVSTAGMALSQWLKSMRDSVLVDWKPQLRDAKSMCTVGTVYLNSPAQTAGLRSGDSLVAFGPVQHADFQSVAETVVPIVKANVGKPIDVVVVRLDETAQVHQVALTLTPKSWSGAGLLGCILK